MLRKLQNLKKKDQGFTIVEVMIVLAIAGLIILIVLLAVPALQRNSRNNGVRNDSARIGGLVQEQVNNSQNGILPNSATTPNALLPANASYARIGAVDYNIAGSFQALPTTLAQDTAYIRNFAVCGPTAPATQGGGQGARTGGTQRSVAITYLVESPGAPVDTTTATGRNPAGFVSQCSSVN